MLPVSKSPSKWWVKGKPPQFLTLITPRKDPNTDTSYFPLPGVVTGVVGKAYDMSLRIMLVEASQKLKLIVPLKPISYNFGDFRKVITKQKISQ